MVLAGAVLLDLGLVLASRSATPTQFLLAYGLLVGVSAGSFFVPMIVGIAPMTVSPFAAWLAIALAFPPPPARPAGLRAA